MNPLLQECEQVRGKSSANVACEAAIGKPDRQNTHSTNSTAAGFISSARQHPTTCSKPARTDRFLAPSWQLAKNTTPAGPCLPLYFPRFFCQIIHLHHRCRPGEAVRDKTQCIEIGSNHRINQFTQRLLMALQQGLQQLDDKTMPAVVLHRPLYCTITASQSRKGCRARNNSAARSSCAKPNGCSTGGCNEGCKLRSNIACGFSAAISVTLAGRALRRITANSDKFGVIDSVFYGVERLQDSKDFDQIKPVFTLFSATVLLFSRHM